MKQGNFKAYSVDEVNRKFTGKIIRRKIDDLPEGSLLVRVHFSSLNYKDALSASGNKGVTGNYPHTPGIDAAGTVVESEDNKFSTGDKVIVTSYDLGMNTDGGFGEYIRVPSQWAVKLPGNLTMKEAMIYGTAGLTAGISVKRLIEQVKVSDGDIIVSGATGGVGSISIALLHKLGYNIAAITGKEAELQYLLALGAKGIIMRNDFENMEKKPLLKPLYAGAIDTVGGVILENIIKSIKPTGVITCCGNVASPKLDINVFPFILRGISLIGIDSQNYNRTDRESVWNELATNWKPESLLSNYYEISLEEVPDKIALMLKGKLKGRTIINMEK